MKPTALLLTFALGTTLLAQGPRAPQQPRPGAGAGLDMAKQQTFEGAITSIAIGTATQYPSIVVKGVTIRVAPAWYLLDHDFELAAGDNVNVTAAPSLGVPEWHAIAITNHRLNLTIVLRSELGIPLWISTGSNSRGPSPQAPLLGQGCLNPGSTISVTGTVESINAALGIQQPTLTLKTASATLTLKIGPERVFLAADFEIKPGDALTVQYAQSTTTGELVALSLTNAAGQTLNLRAATGRPNWN